MKLGPKMPAQMDSSLPAKMPAQMQSDTQPTGDGGSDDAPQVPMSQRTNPGVDYQSVNDDQGNDWQTRDKKTGSAWECSDRKETNKGGRPQRDPDNDGDLN